MSLDKKTFRQLALLIAGGVALYALLQHFSAVVDALLFVWRLFFPFFLGACFAFVLNVPMRALEKHLFAKAPPRLRRFRRVLILLLALLLILAVLVLLVLLIAPEMDRSIEILLGGLPGFAKRAAARAAALADRFPEAGELLDQFNIDWQSVVTSALSSFKEMGQSLFSSTVGAAGSLVSGVVSFVVAFVFCLYILLQKEKLMRQSKMLLYALLPEKRVEPLLDILRLSDRTFSRFLSGQCVEALILGLMFLVAMTVFRFPYAVMVGALVAFTALIPLVGAFIGCFVGAFLILIVDPARALWFVVLFLVLQQIEGNLIYPHVVGSSIGLPSIWVLVAVTVGGSLMGIAGMLIFIPLCSVGYVLLRGWCYKRLKRKKIPPARWQA